MGNSIQAGKYCPRPQVYRKRCHTLHAPPRDHTPATTRPGAAPNYCDPGCRAIEVTIPIVPSSRRNLQFGHVLHEMDSGSHIADRHSARDEETRASRAEHKNSSSTFGSL